MIPLLLALVVGTWNGNWFPSGRAEYRERPEVEGARIEAAGRFLADGLRAADPTGTNGVILVLNEIRDRDSAERLLSAVGRTNLQVAAITMYRLGDKADEQQDVVATTLPVVRSRWARWRYNPEANPPRGYAFAAVVVEPAVTAHVYAVHLKANGGGRDAAVATTNRLKRAAAVDQFLRIEKKGDAPVILAGDFNADRWGEQFADETIFSALARAGYANPMVLLPDGKRQTHLSGSALDYVMTRAFLPTAPPVVFFDRSLSDHAAVFTSLRPVPGPLGTSRALPCTP